jgi:hypothetical protein
MRLLDLMKTANGKIIVSIILAVGLASLLRMSFKNANMIIINGPPVEQTEGKIFSFDNKCYSYKTIATSCTNMENNKDNIL